MGKRKEKSGKEEEEGVAAELTEDDWRALRGSKFAPLPTSYASRPRLAHPGGPLTTNKAAALAKFLQRKLKQPGGLSSIDPQLLELAVNNAKDNLRAASAADGTSSSGTVVRHVDSFGSSSEDSSEEEDDNHKNAGRVTRGKHKKNKKRKKDSGREEEDYRSGERKKRKKHKKEKKTGRKKAGKSAEAANSKNKKKKFKS
ncbi:hypothetical protein ACLOJK_017965 [Asimina triloba]